MEHTKDAVPEYHVVHFFRDNDDGCALTVRASDARFHIIVDREDLRDRSEAGKKISREYTTLLRRVNESEEKVDSNGRPLDGEEGSETESADSGVDMEYEPMAKLHEWIMTPMRAQLKEKSQKAAGKKECNVQQWYNVSIHFFQLTIKQGELAPEELDSDDEELQRRTSKLLPDLHLPKYLRDLAIPMIPASKLRVLSESDDPEPIHPTLVEVDGQQLFLKVVDNNQVAPMKREIRLMKEIENKGLLGKELRLPQLKALVQFDGAKGVMGFVMTTIEEPTPLTHKLDASVPQELRERWAEEARRMVDVLHENDIVWGDAKGDNFQVDKNDELWIIDFGGMYTEGWVDPELNETMEGDEMGTRKIVNALIDPEKNAYEPGVEQAQEQQQQQQQEPMEADTEPGGQENEHRGSKRKHQHGDDSSAVPTGARPPKHRRVSGQEPEQESESDEEMQGDGYCFCGGPDHGRMLACDNDQCEKKWYHFSCLGIERAPSTKKWYCDPCKDHLWDEFGHGKGAPR